MIMEAGESKICIVGQHTGDPGEPVVRMKTEGSLLENSLFVGKLIFLSFPDHQLIG